MIVLTGKSGAGKDTIKKELVKHYGYENIVTYTSRPKRRGEKNGVTYHFISDQEFKDKIEEGFFAEYKSYNVANGDTWYYGCSVRDIEHYEDEKAVIILTPQGVRDVISNVGITPKVIYLYANLETIKHRLNERGDDKEEIDRRISHDNEDFKGWEDEAFKIVYNNLGYDVKKVAEKINQLCEG